MSEWISVDYRLPPEGVVVETIVDDSDPKHSGTSTPMRVVSYRNGQWSRGGIVLSRPTPTHWRPIE